MLCLPNTRRSRVHSVEVKKYCFKGVLKIESFQNDTLPIINVQNEKCFPVGVQCLSALLADKEVWAGQSLSEWSWLSCPELSDVRDHRTLDGKFWSLGGGGGVLNTFQDIRYICFSLFLPPLCPSKWYFNRWMWKWDFGVTITISFLQCVCTCRVLCETCWEGHREVQQKVLPWGWRTSLAYATPWANARVGGWETVAQPGSSLSWAGLVEGSVVPQIPPFSSSGPKDLQEGNQVKTDVRGVSVRWCRLMGGWNRRKERAARFSSWPSDREPSEHVHF